MGSVPTKVRVQEGAERSVGSGSQTARSSIETGLQEHHRAAGRAALARRSEDCDPRQVGADGTRDV